jgi:alanyl-tRNA synthetase
MQLGLQEEFTAEIATVIIEQYQDVYPELETHRAFVLEQLLLEEKRFARTLSQGMREFDKVLSRMQGAIDSYNSLRDALKETLFSRDVLQHMETAREAMKNMGSTLRPTPEAVQFSQEMQKLEEAFATIENFQGLLEQQVARMKTIPGRDAFKLYDTYGFPVEITRELAEEHGLKVDQGDFEERFRQHQKTSQAGAEQRFKGGLADNSEQTTRLHTATHLLQAALRKVLGEEVHQKGSNITAERLRFDFTFGRKVTREELQQVEDLVNQAIQDDLPISFQEMGVEEAKASGAMGLFEDRYGDKVRVYTMGDFSKEICGGPHADSTGQLGRFKIQKEEASSAGVRRIRAVIEN